MKEPIGRRGSFRSARQRRSALRDRGDRFVLADDLAFQLLFHLEQLLGFRLLHALERNAGHFRDDVHHVVAGHEHFLFFALLAPFRQNRIEFLFGLLFLVAQRRGFFEILRLDRGFLFQPNLLDLLLDFLHVRRTRHRVDARARAGFVHHVDRLVGQKAAGDVALGKFDRGLERFVGQLRFVVRFVFRPQTLQNLNRLFDRRRIDLHGLESAFERGVLLDVLAILVHRGRADALQFTAAQSGLDDVRCVHRAFGRTGTDDRVQLVDEKNDVLGAANFVHHRFDALFELAAIFRSGDHQGEVERDDPLVAQKFRNVAVRDFLRQALRDRRLADAGFADQHRIVFRAAAEHLNDALNFVVAADHRIEFAFLRQLGQVATKRAQRGRFDILLARSARLPRTSDGVKFGSSSFRISLRVRSMSISRLFNTRAATPSPSRSSPSKMCSVPT